MDSASPSALELDLGAECDDGVQSPVISETLSVVVNGNVRAREGSKESNTSSGSRPGCSISNGSASTAMFGSSVSDFLNTVSKSDAILSSGQISVTPSILSTQSQSNNMGFYRMGRRVGDVHRHFNYYTRDSKEYGVCVYCGHTLQRNTTRQKHHLSTHCQNAPFDVKARYDQERNSIHTRPAIEFQRKRCLDLSSGATSGNMYPNEMDGGLAITPLDIPVKIERTDDRFEMTIAPMGKSEKSDMRCVPDLEFEDDSQMAPPPMTSINLPNNANGYNHSTRRDVEDADSYETRFRKPLKIWDHSRRIKKGIVVSSLRELIFRGCSKLNISAKDSVRPVLEEDGTEIDDEEYLEYLADNVTIQLLRPGEDWKPPVPYDDAIVRSRHIRHRDGYRIDRRDL